MKEKIIFIFAFCIFPLTTITRSPFRKKDKDIPTIEVSWKHSNKKNCVASRALTEYPIFNVFNGAGYDFFYDHLLPSDNIADVNDPQKTINCHHLNLCIKLLLKELKKHKKEYTHFTVLQDKNFNYKQRCGLLVLQFKNYPFVLKLFMETPKSFIDPYCKGFENQFFFYMSGGMNRHIAGLTRIKNLELVKQQIENHPRWSGKVKTPRKWYWLARKTRWMRINGYNIGGKEKISTLMPSVYAIIADTIDTKEDAQLLSFQEKSELIMQLCMDLHLFVDPHADNFVIKYQKDTQQYHLSIVDTEHFPSIVGLKEEPFFNNHMEWFIYLGVKYFQDAFLQTKNNRRAAQYADNPCALKW